jgi:hypothetical protein
LEEQTGIPIVQVSAKEAIKIQDVMVEITRKLIDRAEKKSTGIGKSSSQGQKISEVGKFTGNDKANCCN